MEREDVIENYKIKLEETKQGSRNKPKLKQLFSLDLSFWRNPKYSVATISFTVVSLVVVVPAIHMVSFTYDRGQTDR